MNRRLVIAFLFLFAGNTDILAQQPNHTYWLNGTINTDTGTIVLYSANVRTANVVDGKFVFTDSISYPIPATLNFYKNGKLLYESGQFFIDPGTQTIACDLYDSLRKSPEMSNHTMKEYKIYTKKLGHIKNEIEKQFDVYDSIQTAYHKNIPDEIAIQLANKKEQLSNVYRSTILLYAKEHPDLYIVLWSLYGMLPRGYYVIYDSIYNHLSKSLKSTYPGRKLAEELTSLRAIMIGSEFPSLHLKSMDDSDVILSNFSKNKYTLIDFWYSHCNPCRQQFPFFKKLYDKYKTEGFEIVGISIDQADAMKDWKKIITDLQIDWPQYRDNDQTNANKLSIQYYPTNFLLNNKGVIIKRNIWPEELEQLLIKGKE